MTDSSDPTPEGTEPERNIADEVTGTYAKLSGGGEKLAVTGAVIVLVGWLLFDLLIDEYNDSHVVFGLAVLIVGAAWSHHRRTSGTDPFPYGPTLIVCAGLLGLIGVWALIEELRDEILEADATTIIGALVFYAGSIMSGIGAFQLSKS